jgi:glucan phosphoethanolaminetransferase (alkaline phosphatase superfamily)
MEDHEKLWGMVIIIPLALIGILACLMALIFFFIDIQYVSRLAALIFLGVSIISCMIIALIILLIYIVLHGTGTAQGPRALETKQNSPVEPLVYITNIQNHISK